MKLSRCHQAKMIRKGGIGAYICSACGYASGYDEVSANDFTRKKSSAYPHAHIYVAKDKKKNLKKEPYPLSI